MLKNHLKLAWRGLLKRKGYSTLNILGLAIGITCCLLIFHYVAYERSYDAFQQNAGRIVRVRLDCYQQGKLAWKSATSQSLVVLLSKDFATLVLASLFIALLTVSIQALRAAHTNPVQSLKTE